MGHSVIDIIRKPSLLFLTFGHKGFFNWMDDEKYLKIAYKIRMGKEINLQQPKTYSEKLQWLKLYDRKQIYTDLVDKYQVKKIVSNIIGENYIIPTLGVWDRAEDIDFDVLPDQFVLKCTHDSGGLVICKDKKKLDMAAAVKKLNACLKHNFYYAQREWPYKNVKPRIIAEPYMEDNKAHELIDYKLMCFNGEVKCSFTCSERFSQEGLKVTFFDNDWKVMPFERHYPSSKNPPKKPLNFNKMLEFATKLSRGIPFVRVDFYEINGLLYFGELTFFPGNGFEEFTPLEWDYKMGSWLKLPK